MEKKFVKASTLKCDKATKIDKICCERGLLNCVSMVYPVCYIIEEFVIRR